MPNWGVTSGHFTVAPYNGDGFPNVQTDLVPGNHGYNLFAGGDMTDTVATQFIDPSAASALIDAGGVNYSLSADLGGWQTLDNNAVKATFLDNMFSLISSVTIGPVTAADRSNLTGLLNRTAAGLVPAGTRWIEVDVIVK